VIVLRYYEEMKIDEIKKLKVDDSEFPVLVSGVLAGKPLILGPLETDFARRSVTPTAARSSASMGDGPLIFDEHHPV